MAIELATKFLPYVDEMFTTESKKSLLTNQDFDWTGAASVKVYKISTSTMNDYDRDGSGVGVTDGEAGSVIWSRYGAVAGLSATTEEFTLSKDDPLPLRSTSWTRTKRSSSCKWRPLWQDRRGKS